jgi:hypothetical protein
MDEEIHELLQRAYSCRIKKLGSHKSKFEVKRKRRIGIKKKILGIFPIYEYETWYDVLSHWTYRTINLRNNFTGKIRWSGRIAICYDEKGNTCYWRYV